MGQEDRNDVGEFAAMVGVLLAAELVALTVLLLFSTAPTGPFRTGVMFFGLVNCGLLVLTACATIRFENRVLQVLLLIAGLNYAGGQITDRISSSFSDSPWGHLSLASGSAIFYLLILLHGLGKLSTRAPDEPGSLPADRTPDDVAAAVAAA